MYVHNNSKWYSYSTSQYYLFILRSYAYYYEYCRSMHICILRATSYELVDESIGTYAYQLVIGYMPTLVRARTAAIYELLYHHEKKKVKSQKRVSPSQRRSVTGRNCGLCRPFGAKHLLRVQPTCFTLAVATEKEKSFICQTSLLRIFPMMSIAPSLAGQSRYLHKIAFRIALKTKISFEQNDSYLLHLRGVRGDLATQGCYKLCCPPPFSYLQGSPFFDGRRR